MTKSDYEKFTQLLVGTAEVLGKGEISSAAQLLWFDALKEYSIEDVHAAFAREIKNTDRKKFFPDPSDIVKQIEGSSADKAMAAWNAVSKCGCGARDTVIFDDPIIHQVIHNMGGWISFMSSNKWGFYEDDKTKETYGYTDQQFDFFRKEFMTWYTSLLRTGQVDPPKKLIGIHEIENRDSFPEHLPEPIRITHDGKKLLPEIKVKYLLPEPTLPGFEAAASPEEVKKMIAEVAKKLKDSPF